jgi:uncharacterized cupredoxin-like copper-binding protein
MTMFDRARRFSLITCCALAFAACGDDNDDMGNNAGGSGGTGQNPANTVAVTVRSFSVTAVPGTAEDGSVTFNVTNTGTIPHEFVVLKTDLAPDQLPIGPDHGVDEEAAGIEAIDEIDEIVPGATEQLVVDLDVGKYVLICNIIDESGAEPVSHYQEGMVTAFTVVAGPGGGTGGSMGTGGSTGTGGSMGTGGSTGGSTGTGGGSDGAGGTY